MRALVVANGLLLLAIGAAIGGVQVLDRADPAIEMVVLRYATAVTDQDQRQAVAELAPAARARWASWVADQLGNVYSVRAVSVRWPSLLDRLLRGAPGRPFEATVVMDVNPGDPIAFYQPTTRVPVVQVDGRWYLGEPLLAPEAAAG